MMIKPEHLIIFLCFESVSIQVAFMAPCGISQCEPVRADLCTSLNISDRNYNQTSFPTKRFYSQDHALLQFNSYSALVQSNCSKKLDSFLCFYYFPPCLQTSCDLRDAVVELDPCQNLCEEVQNECEPVLKEYGQTWNFNCSKFSPSQLCLDVPETPTEPDPATSNPIAPSIDMCHSINNSICASLHSSYTTFFPNANFNSKEAADLHFQSFEAALNHNDTSNDTECSVDQLKFLLCTSHYPVCLPDKRDSSKVSLVYPCKNVCNKVRRNCEQLLLDNNGSWPELLDCSKFPSKNDGICIDSSLFESDEMEPDSKCEPIDPRVQRICGAVNENYTLTDFPHGDFETQDDAYEAFEAHLASLNNCSAEVIPFLCYHYFPSCSPDDQAEPKVPCRSVCRKARTGCEKCHKKWPDEFNCDNYRVNKNCITLKDIDDYTSTFVRQPCKPE